MQLLNVPSIAPGGSPLLSDEVMYAGGINSELGISVGSATSWASMEFDFQGSVDKVNWFSLNLSNGNPAKITDTQGSGFYTLQGIPQSCWVRLSVKRPTTTVTQPIIVVMDNVIPSVI